MARKPKFTRKDDYLLMLGISVALLFQVIYDMLHEVIYNEINLGWLGIQGGIIFVFAAFALIILRKMDSYSGPV
jgi:hypothetical protein